MNGEQVIWIKRKKEKRSNKAIVRFRPKVPKRKQAENKLKAEPERPSCPFNKLGTVMSDYEAR